MGLIDDAKRLVQPGIGTHCDFCTGSPISGHFDGCPLLSMGAILEVLEAAERFVAAEVTDDRDANRVERLAAINALVAAMRGLA